MKVTGDFQEGEIQVFDLQGRLMLRQDLASNNAIKFDVSTFSDGLYFVKVQLDGEHFTERLFVAEKN